VPSRSPAPLCAFLDHFSELVPNVITQCDHSHAVARRPLTTTFVSMTAIGPP
jgi:hypothetical protein